MTALDLRSLEVFRAVAETGSATGAAAVLHTTQPSVTRAVAEFERRCGFALFERVRLGMRLTAEGEMLLETVRRNFDGLLSVQNAVAAIRQGEVGTLSARFLPVVMEGLLADIIGAFIRENAKVRVLLDIASPAQMYASLSADQVDFGVSIGPTPSGFAVDKLRIGRSTLMLAVGRHHRLARARHVGFDAIGGEALVQLPPPHNIRAAIDMLLLNTGIRPALVHEAGTQRAAVRLVERTDCVTFVDSHVSAEFDRRRLAAIPIEPEIAWDIDIIHRRDRRQSKTFLNFLAFVKRGMQAPPARRPWQSLTPGPHLLIPGRRRQRA